LQCVSVDDPVSIGEDAPVVGDGARNGEAEHLRWAWIACRERGRGICAGVENGYDEGEG